MGDKTDKIKDKGKTQQSCRRAGVAISARQKRRAGKPLEQPPPSFPPSQMRQQKLEPSPSAFPPSPESRKRNEIENQEPNPRQGGKQKLKPWPPAFPPSPEKRARNEIENQEPDPRQEDEQESEEEEEPEPPWRRKKMCLMVT